MSEAMVEGGIRVSGPPNAAGRRGRVTRHDWERIAPALRARPDEWYLYTHVVAGEVGRLQERYPDIEFRGILYRWMELTDHSRQRVCDLYVCYPNGVRDG